MKKGVTVVLALLLCMACAMAIDPTQLASAKMRFVSSGMFEKDIKEADYKLSYVTVNLTTYPRNTRWQSISNQATNPSAEFTDNAALFKWENPTGNVFYFKYEADVSTNTGTMFVDKQVSFPLTDVPEEYEVFTKPSETIDSNDLDIISLANSLAEGEDDQFVVVFKLADWIINNIEYNLSTITVEASQKASWVLDKRYGVCDEITTLFLAMCRSLGIPARFVTGTAYTNYAGQNDWGNHAWSEIYFPGVGWVPYDLTYKQIGYTDGSHVKLQHNVDANYIYTKYRWLGRGVDIKTYGLDMNTTLVSEGKMLEPKELIRVHFLKERTDFYSYNALVVNLENPSNVYVTTELILAQSTGYEFTGSSRHNIMLQPRESKTYYFPLRLTEDFKKNYEYTFFGGVSTPQNNSKEASFKVLENDPYYSLEDISSIISQKTNEETKNFTSSINMVCTALENEIMKGEQASLTCTLTNLGNTQVRGVQVCLENCQLINLSIAKSKEVEFQIAPEDIGKNELIVTASNEDLTSSASAFIDVLDAPKLAITNLTYPSTLEYTDPLKISFIAKKESFSKPKNILVYFDGRQVFDLTKEIENSKKFTINSKAMNLPDIESQLEIEVQYEDIRGNTFSESETLRLTLINLNWWQRLSLFFNKSPVKASSILASILIFTLILVYVFYKGARTLIFKQKDMKIIQKVDSFESKTDDNSKDVGEVKDQFENSK